MTGWKKEKLMNEENDKFWGWWMLVPVVALGLLAYQISVAAMTSVFDEDE
jgi:hypothetical protein